MVLETRNCTRCGTEYEGNSRERYCSSCKVVARKEVKRRSMDKTGRHLEYVKWYQVNTVKGLEGVARRKKSETYKAKQQRGNAKYRATLKGQLTVARYAARRAGHPIGDLVEVMTWIQTNWIPCNVCGSREYPCQEPDHIIPLALGPVLGLNNLNDFWNLQPICQPCHRVKTNGDVSYISRAKKESGLLVLIAPPEVSTSYLVARLNFAA